MKKAINFDLDTHKMQEAIGSKTKGYNILKSAFKNYGFSHRQGSGYVSINDITDRRVIEVVTKITEKYPWLADCAGKIDVTNVGSTFDLLPTLKSVGETVYGNTQKKKDNSALKETLKQGSGRKSAPIAESTDGTPRQTKKETSKGSLSKKTTKSNGLSL